jgi:hypothetical protein
MDDDTRMNNTTGFKTVGITPKVREPEVFKGERNALMVESWINSMDLYFQLVRVEHGQEQLLYALSLLRGDAQLWYSQMRVYEAEQLPQDWSDFKMSLRKEFVPINAIIQARDKLAALVQNGPVSGYINDFRRLKLQIPDLSHGDALDRFVRGLVKIIRVAVRSRFPATLAEAESLALAIEAAAQDEEGYAVPIQQQVQPKVNYDPMDLDSLREQINALAGQVRQQGGGYRPSNGGYKQSSGYGTRGGQTGSRNGNGPRCFACHGFGHMKRECPTFLNKTQGRNGSTHGNLKD